jgi:hypothetical protein
MPWGVGGCEQGNDERDRHNTHRKRAFERVESDVDFVDKIGGDANTHGRAGVDVVQPAEELLIALEGDIKALVL